MPDAFLSRAWIDDAQAEWDREARTYGPDDDESDDDGDDTAEIELPLLTPDYDDDRR